MRSYVAYGEVLCRTEAASRSNIMYNNLGYGLFCFVEPVLAPPAQSDALRQLNSSVVSCVLPSQLGGLAIGPKSGNCIMAYHSVR